MTRMEKITMVDGDRSFDVTIINAKVSCRYVLFAVGGGGDPVRHAPLLMSLAEKGCSVIAPHFSRLTSASPTTEELLLRGRRLKLAMDTIHGANTPIAGVGHSIGTAMLLALAGGKMWMRQGQQLSIAFEPRIDRLALLAPVTGYFRVPGALEKVTTPILAWAGTEDLITPPAQAQMLCDVIGERVPVDIHISKGAGHFSFMNVPPPLSTEPLCDRGAFLLELSEVVSRFVIHGDQKLALKTDSN